MDIGKIDINLANSTITKTDICWRSARKEPFAIHGVIYDEAEGQFIRLPTEVSKAVSNAVYNLSKMTSGGRVRFKTDSPYVALYCRAPRIKAMPHMPLSGSHGFSIYCNGKYAGKVTPSVDEVMHPHEEGILFSGEVNLPAEQKTEIEVYMPLYAGVCELLIGVKEGSAIEAPRPYTYTSPIVLYGSSITQGACASRPGNDYAMRLSRLFDADVLNLGFSGNGNAEPAMLAYLASLDASAFIFDYNYYVSRPERVLPPHFEVYNTLRTANPKTPILMVDKPAYMFAGENYKVRSKIIRETYEKAKELGDERIDMMDATAFFGFIEPDACVVDTDHPNDLGFYRMADATYPKLKKLLEGNTSENR